MIRIEEAPVALPDWLDNDFLLLAKTQNSTVLRIAMADLPREFLGRVLRPFSSPMTFLPKCR